MRPVIEKIIEENPDGVTFWPEDVYAAVVNNEAVLYANDDGFAVCTIETDQWSGEKDFLVWLAAKWPGGRDIVRQYLPDFADTARQLGCRGIIVQSNHPVFRDNPDWTADYTVYRHKLNE